MNGGFLYYLRQGGSVLSRVFACVLLCVCVQDKRKGPERTFLLSPRINPFTFGDEPHNNPDAGIFLKDSLTLFPTKPQSGSSDY